MRRKWTWVLLLAAFCLAGFMVLKLTVPFSYAAAELRHSAVEYVKELQASGAVDPQECAVRYFFYQTDHQNHTFATHLIKAGVGVVTLRDLLGHRQIPSTQVYIHLTAQDLRRAAQLHPIAELIKRVDDLLPDVKLPFQESAVWRFG